MADKNTDFLKGLIAIFKIEAQEHIDVLISGIAELEKTKEKDKQAGLIETIFREAHSLKGAARSVKLPRIEAACQTLENTLAAMKRQEIELTPFLFDNLHQFVSELSTMLFSEEAMQASRDTQTDKPAAPPQFEMAAAVLPQPEPLLKTPSITASTFTVPEQKQGLPGTVRIATAKLDSLLLQTEEMLAMKLSAQQRKRELLEIMDLVAACEKDWGALRVRHPGIPRAATTQPGNDLLESTTVFVKTLRYRLDLLGKSIDQDQRLSGRMVDALLGGMKEALMLPFSTLTETFPRMVREFAREAGKEIHLTIQGGEIEADRRILAEIKDPLLHLIRNGIDHGIEQPAQRTERHKPREGTLSITFKPRDGNRVEISIADDGAGINIGEVKASAARLGILSTEQRSKLDSRQALELIYQSGLSTSPIITEISGRGLGLAIVQEKVDRLGGSITLDTQSGSGSTFRILLPLMFATYRGIVVRVGEHLFVLPAANAEQTLRVDVADIMTVENRETITLHGATLALVRLSDVLALPRRDATLDKRLQVVVLAAGRKRIAFAVDEVLYEQEVLVKSLGKQLVRVRNIAGATILGSGQAVPVLNVYDLMKSALAVSAATPAALQAREEPRGSRKSVLVVEDSITARSLLKGILESAGYRVVTAIDGIDGLTQLRSGEFDLVVSDVEMPRMNGFELTAKIRSDKQIAELPVVLVTALASRADREHGIDVGANAYIVKNSFEQSNLLEVVQRLI